MPRSHTYYVCSRCGYESAKWMGQCPSCHEWNTMEEREREPQSSSPAVRNGYARVTPKERLVPLKKVSLNQDDRLKTGISELDRVLGGGLVRDSVSILAAKPGAGKSTLMLQLSEIIAAAGHPVLYVSGEESESQIRSRAARILPGISDNLWVLSTSRMNEVLSAVDKIDPDLILLDSIQTFFLEELPSRPGSPTQLTECTGAIIRMAKDPSRPRAVMMAGQLTKEDELAGVRSLEHMVDTVLYMEADPVEEIRTLCATKNRFGSTGEMGFFTMEENGLLPIQNPSRYFMTTREDGVQVTGSALSVMREGTRPMIVEIESLISQSYTPYPSRISECMSRDQMGTLVSVLEQRAGITLFDQNVVIKSTGGLRLNQNSVNLAVLMSLASSALKKPLPDHTVFIGDVGLTGELKKVPAMDLMIRECARLGFAHIVIPKGSMKAQTAGEIASLTQVTERRDLASAVRTVFGDYRQNQFDKSHG